MNRPSLRPKASQVEEGEEEEDEQGPQRRASQHYLYNDQMQYYVADRPDVAMEDYFPPQTYPLASSSSSIPTLANSSHGYGYPEDYQFDHGPPSDMAIYAQNYPSTEGNKQQGFVEPSIYSPPVPPPPPLIHAISTLSNSTSDEIPSTPTGPFMRPVIEDQGFRAERRRAQNRAAQRAYRQRKEQTLKKRDDEIERLRVELEESQKANEGLVAVVSALKEKLKDP